MASVMACANVAVASLQSSSARISPASSTFRFAAPSIVRSRRCLVVRADSKRDDNPVANALADIEDKAQGFVEATKENSGLDERVLGSTNAPGVTEGTPSELGAFSGLLPEIINGRGAMVGMLAAFGAEAATKQPVFVQIQKAPVLIAATFVTIILASVIPAIRGADLNRKGAGPFTPQAEVWNGRLAMVAFILLLTVETWKAGPGLAF